MKHQPRPETLARAVRLVELLMDGPKTWNEIMDGLGLENHMTFRNTLSLAREVVVPQHGMTIPRPTAEDDYRYRVSAEWIDADDPAIRDGVRVSTTDCRTRVESIIRDLQVASDNVSGRTSEGRQVRQYLNVMKGALTSLELVDEKLGVSANAA